MIEVWTWRWTLGFLLLFWACIGWVFPMADIMGWGGWGTLISVGISLVIFLICRWWAPKYWEEYAFEVRDDEVVVSKGVLFTRRTSIPFARIQNINVIQGPIMRRYELQSISIETAGSPVAQGGFGIQGEGHLAGLPDEFAQHAADELMDLVKAFKAREGI